MLNFSGAEPAVESADGDPGRADLPLGVLITLDARAVLTVVESVRWARFECNRLISPTVCSSEDDPASVPNEAEVVIDC